MSFETDNTYVFPCASRNFCYCYVVIWSDAALSEKTMFMCNQLCTFLTIKRQERIEVQQKGIERLFFDFILNNSLPQNLARDEFDKLGLDTTGELQVAILTSEEPDTNKRFLHFRFFAADFSRIVKSSVNRMEAYKTTFFIGYGSLRKHREGIEKFQNLLEKYQNLRFCIGPCVQDLANLPFSYKLAERCLKLSPSDEKFVDYRSYSHWLALLAGMDSFESKWLAEQYFKPFFTNADEKEAGLLFDTLDAALFANTIEEAAAKLKIHVNTMRYRLKKVKKTLGLDFFHPHERNVLSIAFMMHKGEFTLYKN